MKYNPVQIYQFQSKRKGRNPSSFTYSKKVLLKEKPKTISAFRRIPTSPCSLKQFPILTFPLSNSNNSKTYSSFFLTSSCFYNPLSAKNNKLFKTIMSNSTHFKNKYQIDISNNKFKKKFSESRFTKPVIISKTIENKIKESKKSQKLKKINILDFGNYLKLYDEKEQKQKEKVILEKRSKELDDIYSDYDKKNRKKIMNSFSGNRADLLKNKIVFVKGIVDYLYPKLVLNKMDFINDMKERNYKEGRKQMQKDLKCKYYITKHRNPEQTSAMSKYLYGGDLDIIRPRDNIIDLKKTFINKCIVSKLTHNYDYI